MILCEVGKIQSNKRSYSIFGYNFGLKFKEGMKTNNQGSLKLAEILENKWKVRCDQARCAYIPSQNDMDEILNAKTNWNRKLFNKSYKPIK